MSNLFLWIFLLTILYSILFYGKTLGLSVILFVPLVLMFVIYVLKKYNKIQNKKGLLFIIPILLLSLTYFIYDNAFFYESNFMVIFGLFILIYIYTIKPTFILSKIINDAARIIFEPLTCISKIFNLLGGKISKKVHLSEKHKKIIKSIIIILPIVCVVLALLSSADMMFDELLSKGFSNVGKVLERYFSEDLLGRLITMFIFFIYMSASLNFIIFNYKEEKEVFKEKKEKDPFTIHLLLTVLNIIYIIFDFIQIRSLLFHYVSSSVNYAEYARQGFFQLMFVSMINITVILIAKRFERENSKYIKIQSIIMVFLTFIIVISSFLRMHLYESMYGYTFLRLLVYTILIGETVLFIPTILYILKSKFNILKYYMIIILIFYVSLNYLNPNVFIAKRNIQRYEKTGKIDICYLENFDSDSVLELYHLYKNTNDKEIKNSLKNYFNSIDLNMNGISEYNLSKMKAKRVLRK